jgi:predicted esterase
MRLFFVLAVVVVRSMALSPALWAATLSTPTDVAFSAAYDGSTQRYVQLLPTDFDPQRQYDLVIALHGSGSDRWQYAIGTGNELRATRDAAANHDMIMICPDYRATTSWMGPAAEADMLQIVQNLKNQYHIGKTIVTGGSMGGTGSLTFTALHPDLVDGVCSVNGLANFVGYQSSNTSLLGQIIQSFGGTESEVPAEYAKRSAINSPQSFTMPLSITAGGLDSVVPPQSVLQLANTVKNINPVNPNVVSFYRATGGHSTPYADNAVALEYVIQNARGIDTDLHPITINTSFEYQKLTVGQTVDATVDGWTASGSGVGVARLTSSSYAAKFDGPIPDGSQLALAANNALYQFMGTTVRPGTYHLSLAVASGKDNPQVGTLLTGFLVADNNIAGVSDLTWGAPDAFTAGPGLTPGKWTTINVDWVVRPGSSAIGKYLYINFWGNSSNAVYFDNVGVSFTPVPEPSVSALLGPALIGSLVYVWRKRM